MTTLFLRNADVLVTMDAERHEIKDGALLVQDNVIQAVGTTLDIEAQLASQPTALRPDRVINARGAVVLPGLINCHHHLYQTLTRAVGTSGGMILFDWLKTLYPIWAEMDAEAVYVSAKVGLSELVLSGATTVADHLYLFPNDATLDDEIRAAQEVGVRFHPTRGSMSLGESKGGLPPDRVCDSEVHILEDSQRVIERFHDPEPYSMLRIGLAPCSPFSVTTDLMRESAALARQYPLVNLHTHLSETKDEDRFCLDMFGMRPVEYAESLDWKGEDVWFAHVVHPNPTEIRWLARTRTGVCHCPTSNMILASGIAPVREMLDNMVRVGLGVDGSASNDGNHLLGEARQAMLLQRVGWPGFESRADRLSAREALELATLGGAQVLRRDDIGSLEPGKSADIVAFRLDDLAHAGGLGDPVATLVTCAPAYVWLSVINGQVVVEDGELRTVAVEPMIQRHNQISQGMLERSGVG
jgi:cytosine/adenosine deaminase-related metal-dependent hydrolase